MLSYIIYKDNNIFSIYKDAVNFHTNVYGKLNIVVDFFNHYIECEIIPDHPFEKKISLGVFYLGLIIRGRYQHYDSQFLFDIECDNVNEGIIIKSKLYTDKEDGIYLSISRFIERTLNQISKFKSISDLKEFFIINENNENDLEDEIINIARIISLIKKYEEIDPVFPLKTQMEEWVQSKLKKIMKKEKE